jgi:putative cell wall-binding protein
MAKTITEIRADFRYTFKAVITVIVTGFVGAVWLGVKATLGK